MPASCANALRPTIALLAWTGSLVSLRQQLARLEQRAALIAGVVRAAGPAGRGAPSRALRATALPARSPMPLIVHSIWRTPPWTAARLLATARPRSSWQCALKTAWSAFGTRPTDLGEEVAGFVRRRVADRVRQVDRRRAFADRRLDDAAQEIAVAPRRVLRRKLHIVGELPREADAVDDRLEARLARDAQLGVEVQIGGREKRVDARPLGRLERARRLLDVLRRGSGPARR